MVTSGEAPKCKKSDKEGNRLPKFIKKHTNGDNNNHIY